MSRPKPKVLIEIADREIYKVDQVLYSDGIWTIFYDGEIINLKSSAMTKKGLIHKYKKCSFSNPGHAVNLAKKLNKQFKTDKFSVVKLNKGDTIYNEILKN